MAEMGSNVGPQLKEWWFIKDDQVMNPDTTHASLHTELESRAACFCHVLVAFPGAFRVPPSSSLCSRPLGFVVRFVCDSVCPLTPYTHACTSSCGVESRHDQTPTRTVGRKSLQTSWVIVVTRTQQRPAGIEQNRVQFFFVWSLSRENRFTLD